MTKNEEKKLRKLKIIRESFEYRDDCEFIMFKIDNYGGESYVVENYRTNTSERFSRRQEAKKYVKDEVTRIGEGHLYEHEVEYINNCKTLGILLHIEYEDKGKNIGIYVTNSPEDIEENQPGFFFIRDFTWGCEGCNSISEAKQRIKEIQEEAMIL